MSYCECSKTEKLYPLHEAIFKGDIEEVKRLMETCDLEQQDCGGNTPMLVALKTKNISIVVFT